MKVYFDIITNHTADVIGYQEGARTAYVPKDKEPYRIAAGSRSTIATTPGLAGSRN
jgi:alpha-amylase